MAWNVYKRCQSIDGFIECLLENEVAATSVDTTNHNLEVPKVDRGGWDDELLELIGRIYTRHMGPIAPAMVKRALQQSASFEGLAVALSESLETDKEIKAFLSSLGFK